MYAPSSLSCMQQEGNELAKPNRKEGWPSVKGENKELEFSLRQVIWKISP